MAVKTKNTDPKAAFTMPKTLAGCADELYAIREARLALSKEVDELKSRESRLTDHLIESLPKSDASGIAGKVAKVSVSTKVVPQVKDWEAFYAYIKKNSAFEMLQRRVSDVAVKERWEDGKQVPGVERFNTVSLSVTKV